jgi:hypothetical protein
VLPRTALALFLAAALGACGGPPGHPDLPCAPGESLDGERCVPLGCGEGPWGAAGEDADYFVAPWGDDGDDGDAENPFASVQLALDVAGEAGGGVVALSEGEWVGLVELWGPHIGVELRGRCPDLSVLRAPGEVEGEVVVSAYAPLRATLRDVSLRDGYVGFYAESGGPLQMLDVVLDGVEITGFANGGVMSFGGGTSLDLRSVSIHDSGEILPDLTSFGIAAVEGAHIVARSLRIERIRGIGVGALDAGSSIELDDARVADVAEDPAGYTSSGLVAQDGASVVARDLVVERVAQGGALASTAGALLDLERSVIRDPLPLSDGSGGRGLSLQDGGLLVARDLVIERAHDVGIFVASVGTVADLDGATIRGTRLEPAAPNGASAEGIAVQEGGVLLARGLLVEDSIGIGIGMMEAGSHAEVDGLIIRGTRSAGTEPLFARGLEVDDGANFVGRNVRIEGNEQAGVLSGGLGAHVELYDSVVADQVELPGAAGGGGIAVQSGATVHLERVLVLRNPGIGVVITEGGGALVDVWIEDSSPTGEDYARGLGVQDGAQVTAEGLVIDGFAEVGVFIGESGALLEIADSVVRGGRAPPGDPMGGRGVAVGPDASLVAEGLLLEDNQEVGILVGAGSSAQLVDVTVRGTQPDEVGAFGTGLHVQEGGVVDATRLLLLDNHSVGALAGLPGSRISLRDSAIQRTQPARDGSFGRGVELAMGGTLVAWDTDIDENHEIGVHVRGAGSRAELHRVHVRATRDGADLLAGMGIVLSGGGTMLGEDVVVAMGDGPGLLASDGGTAICGDCRITGNRFAGAVAWGGVLTLEGGEIRGSRRHPDYGGGAGVFAWSNFEASELTLLGTTFEGLPGPAVYLREPGSYELWDVLLDGVGTAADAPGGLVALDGIGPWDGSAAPGEAAGLLVQGTEFRGIPGDAVLLHDSGATLAGNVFVDVGGADVHRQACDGAPELELLDAEGIDLDDCEGEPREIDPRLFIELQLLDFAALE